MEIVKRLIGFLLLPCVFVSAQSYSQDIEWALNESNVGVGTGAPEAKLHVKSDEYSYTRPLLVENTSGIGFSGFSLKIASDSWIDFNNSGGKFRINVDRTPGAEFEVRPNGDATLSGALTQNSDVDAKQEIVGVNHDEVLDKLMQLPISEWSYIDNPGARHIGPMAQDFYQLFTLGDTERGISSIDTGGVALAAIQGLHVRLEDKAGELEQVKAENVVLRAQMQQHNERMLQLEIALAELMRDRDGKAQVSSISSH